MAAFIRFEGVDGSATERNHKAWSDIESFNLGMHQPGGTSAGQTHRRGDVVVDDMIVSKKLDKAGLKIAEAALKGKVFPKVEIHVVAPFPGIGRQTYYEYELRNVMVTSYSVQGSGVGREVPVEDLALNFEEIKVTLTEITRKGKIKGKHEYKWKVETGDA